MLLETTDSERDGSHVKDTVEIMRPGVNHARVVDKRGSDLPVSTSTNTGMYSSEYLRLASLKLAILMSLVL